MRISDWSSDVCSSDLAAGVAGGHDDGPARHPEEDVERPLDDAGPVVTAAVGAEAEIDHGRQVAGAGEDVGDGVQDRGGPVQVGIAGPVVADRKSTRLNSSH